MDPTEIATEMRASFAAQGHECGPVASHADGAASFTVAAASFPEYRRGRLTGNRTTVPASVVTIHADGSMSRQVAP
jgi:hypothetical protein